MGGKTSQSSEGQYFIIGGASKAATTSVFFYLAAHPQVCQSSMKETRFFLDLDYPVESKYRYTDGLDKYYHYFNRCAEQETVHETVKVEATPDYLYSPGTAGRVHASLPDVTMCFILREPVSRLISWYRYAVQRSLIPTDMSFDDYVDRQLHSPAERSLGAPQVYRALEQGRYSRYLTPYFETFGENCVCILLYDDVAQNPQAALAHVANMAGIDSGFYDQYTFNVHNTSQPVRFSNLHHAYISLRSGLRKRTHDHAKLHQTLKRVRRQFDRMYEPLNMKTSNKQPDVEPDTLDLLHEYYENDSKNLSSLLERDLSHWTMPDPLPGGIAQVQTEEA